MLYPINLDEEMLVQAVKEFNMWQGSASIRYDLSDGAVWTDVYPDDNTEDYYRSKTIVTTVSKDNFLGRDCETSVARVRAFAIRCHKYDWEEMDADDAYYWMQEILYEMHDE